MVYQRLWFRVARKALLLVMLVIAESESKGKDNDSWTPDQTSTVCVPTVALMLEVCIISVYVMRTLKLLRKE